MRNILQKNLIQDLKIDSVLLIVVLILIMIGLITLSSASSAVSENDFGTPFYYLNRQLFAIFLGSLGAFICLMMPIEYWEKMGPIILAVGKIGRAHV